MNITEHINIDELLNFLEKPEHAGQIKYLANLEHLKDVNEVKGPLGALLKLGTSAAGNQIDALLALAKCKTTADITAFRHTPHYETLKKGPIHLGNNIGISNLKDLEKLKDLGNLKDLGSLTSLLK